MAAPPNTYNSPVNLSLTYLSQIDDPILYGELLDIHNAIEALLQYSTDSAAIFEAYIQKRRSFRTVTADTTVSVSDGTILIDASLNPVTVTLHPAADGIGHRYNLKCIDDTNTVLVIPTGLELIDLAFSWELHALDDLSIISDGSNYWIE